MKHISRFKIFSETLNESSINEWNTSDIIQTVKDILLPINDMGYYISVFQGPLSNRRLTKDDESQLIIRVVSWGDQSLFITDEVKEEFIRMKDYLESEGYNSIEVLYHLATPGVVSSRDIKEFDDFMKYEPWQKVKIQNLLFVAK
jgi:hypothetical protein